MKKLILLTSIIICCMQFSVAQKIYLEYKIKTNDSILVFRYKSFSDKKIETNAQNIFHQQVPGSIILSVEDNINRKFIKLKNNHDTNYLKQLNGGFYNLYESNTADALSFYICSKTDTIVLVKNDTAGTHTKGYLSQYQKLAYLAKDYPEYWPKAKAVKFNKSDLQAYISELNSKYPDTVFEAKDNVWLNYSSISLKGFASQNHTTIMFDFIKSYYHLCNSPDITLKYGFQANYYRETEFFPASPTGYYIIQNGVSYPQYFYNDHYETLKATVFELPVLVNFEITNSLFTPFWYVGLAPTIYFRKITRTDSNETDKLTKLALNVFTAAGCKLKITEHFNVTTEYRYEYLRRLSFLMGLEYFFKPHLRK